VNGNPLRKSSSGVSKIHCGNPFLWLLPILYLWNGNPLRKSSSDGTNSVLVTGNPLRKCLSWRIYYYKWISSKKNFAMWRAGERVPIKDRSPTKVSTYSPPKNVNE
jgi:hypothetical protein